MHPATGFIIILTLIGISALIALSEIAFAAARNVRMQALAEAGNKKAKRFLALRDNAGHIITTLQIATNAVAILAGIVGEGFLGPVFTNALYGIGVGDMAEPAGTVLAFCLVTSMFVLFADLVPKRIAMMMPETVALSVLWFPEYALKLLRPLVWVFNGLSSLFIKGMHLQDDTKVNEVTAEDFRMVLAGGEASGALMKNEHRLIENVLALERRSVTSIMTVRDDIEYLDISDPITVQHEKVRRRPFAYYPLCEGGIDGVLGCVRAEDVLATAINRDEPIDFNKARRDVLSVPDTLNVWEVLSEFQAQNTGFALVISEYAHVVGLVTYKDLMGALMVGLVNPFEEQAIMRRDDQSWLVDGMTPIMDVARALNLKPTGQGGTYETIGGFIVHRLRRAARKGDKIEAYGYIFEVVDADRMRLNQLLVTKQSAKAAPAKTAKPD